MSIRNGNGLNKQTYGNTPSDATPISSCPLPDGSSQSIVQWSALGISILMILFHRPILTLILSVVKDPVKRHNLFNRLDQIQSEWGSWVGKMGNRRIQESTPSKFGAGFTLAFLPVAIFIAIQLIMANDPICTVGLQVPSERRAHGLMMWKVSLPTAPTKSVCSQFDSSQTIGFDSATLSVKETTCVNNVQTVECLNCVLDGENVLVFDIPHSAQVARIEFSAPSAAPGASEQISWSIIRPQNGTWIFPANTERVQTFRVRESFFEDKTVGRTQGVRTGETGEFIHEGFVITAEPPTSAGFESKTATFDATSTWKIRIRVLRAETIQYVEKAYTQDSVQLFFAVIAGVSSLFAIWTSVLYGWAAGFFKRCEKKTKGKPKEKVEGIEIPSVQDMDKNKLHQLVKELVAIEMAKQTVDATEDNELNGESETTLQNESDIQETTPLSTMDVVTGDNKLNGKNKEEEGRTSAKTVPNAVI